ncbi:MAG: lysostaphin resistance A-like protein [Candidatus Promineifilaceae bacterium]
MMWFANQAEKARPQADETSIYAIFAYGMVVLLQFGLFLAGIGAQMVGVALTGPNAIDTGPIPGAENFDLSTINFTLIGAGLWIPALVGLLLLIPPVRRLVARIIPIEAPNHVHAIALSLATIAVPNMLVTVGIGLENLAGNLGDSLDAASLISTTWMQNLGFFLIGLFGVGLFSTRTFPQALKRLKIERISLREVGLGAAYGIGLLLVMGTALSGAEALGWGNPTVDALSEELYGPFFESIWGILTIGLAAAWGEETIFRGALQPKFGRILTAILFAIVHGNYGFSIVTVAILFVGYLLGVIRDRHNTSTSMVTHAVFNSVQALAAFLAVQYGIGG